MPRLTDQTYLQHRRRLVELWNSPAATPIFLLSAAEQWALHAYYLMSQQVSDEILLEHRHDIPSVNFVSPLGRKFQGTQSKPSKTTLARHIVAQPSQLSDYSEGLLEHIEELSNAIRIANGLATHQPSE